MDSQYLLIQPQGSDFALLDHRPGSPDMTLHIGTEADCIARASLIVSGIGWESVPVYSVQPDRTWKAIA